MPDSAGNLYGTTPYGGDLTCPIGSLGCGAVFELSKSGQETVLHTFTGGTDGAFPLYESLIRDSAGNLYGTTLYGGDLSCNSYGYGCGVVFKLSPAGEETVLHTFAGGADGEGPVAGLVQDSSGNLYGTTAGGGAHNYGTVFKIDASGNETVLFNFNGERSGFEPIGTLLLDKAGNLYGTTNEGGAANAGVVFKLKP